MKNVGNRFKRIHKVLKHKKYPNRSEKRLSWGVTIFRTESGKVKTNEIGEKLSALKTVWKDVLSTHESRKKYFHYCSKSHLILRKLCLIKFIGNFSRNAQKWFRRLVNFIVPLSRMCPSSFTNSSRKTFTHLLEPRSAIFCTCLNCRKYLRGYNSRISQSYREISIYQ